MSPYEIPPNDDSAKEHSKGLEFPRIFEHSAIEESNEEPQETEISYQTSTEVGGITVRALVANYINGELVPGEHPEPIVQEAIENSLSYNTSELIKSFELFDSCPDSNHRYHDFIEETKEISSANTENAQVKVVNKDTLKRFVGDIHPHAVAMQMPGNRILIPDWPLELNERFLRHFLVHETHHYDPHNEFAVAVTTLSPDGKNYTVNSGGAPLGVLNSYKPGPDGNKIKGKFWEESQAELNTVIDVEKFGTPQSYLKTMGVTKDGETITVYKSTADSYPITIPQRFAKDFDGRYFTHSGGETVGAYGLHLLNEAVPGLLDEMKAARTDPARLGNVISMVDSVKDGLYGELNDISDIDSFYIGTLAIQNALGRKE